MTQEPQFPLAPKAYSDSVAKIEEGAENVRKF